MSGLGCHYNHFSCCYSCYSYICFFFLVHSNQKFRVFFEFLFFRARKKTLFGPNTRMPVLSPSDPSHSMSYNKIFLMDNSNKNEENAREIRPWQLLFPTVVLFFTIHSFILFFVPAHLITSSASSFVSVAVWGVVNRYQTVKETWVLKNRHRLMHKRERSTTCFGGASEKKPLLVLLLKYEEDRIV